MVTELIFLHLAQAMEFFTEKQKTKRILLADIIISAHWRTCQISFISLLMQELNEIRLQALGQEIISSAQMRITVARMTTATKLLLRKIRYPLDLFQWVFFFDIQLLKSIFIIYMSRRKNIMVKLFTHTDLDGIGCEILAKIAFSKDVDVTNSEVSDINKNIKEFLDNSKNNGIYDKIYITDISVNKENAERLSNRPEKVQLLDHHGTALWLNQYPWAHVRVKDKETGILTSGTELMYKNLEKEGLFKSLDNKHSKQLKQFTEAVRDYDTYRFDKMGEDGKLSRDLNDLMFIKGSIPFKNDVYNQLNIGAFPFFSEADRAMLDMSHKKLENYIKDKNENIEVFTINGYKGGLVYAEQNFSELGNKLCEMNPKLDFIAMVEPTKGFVSIRSRKDDIDVGKDIAVPLGGGGHAKSAGAPLKDEMKLLFRNALEDAVSAGATIRNGHLMEVDFSKKSKFFNPETGQLTISAGITAIDGIFKKNEVDLQNRLKIKSVVIESDIKEIPNGLFANCKNLEAVKFNDSLEKIEGEAFLGCERLQGISLPDSLKNIDNYAFAFCKNLSGMDMSNELYEKLISENKLGDIFMETNLDMNEFMKEKEQEIKDSEIENPDIDDIEQE